MAVKNGQVSIISHKIEVNLNQNSGFGKKNFQARFIFCVLKSYHYFAGA